MLNKKNKKRKEMIELNLLMKSLLKRMYKKYGYQTSYVMIENMKEPTFNERSLMLEYIYKLYVNELNKKAER